jgi:hypothetical protein
VSRCPCVSRRPALDSEVVSGDRDVYHLVDDARVPAQWYADFAVLRGGLSNGLPGVPGVGEKTAARPITRYGFIGRRGVRNSLLSASHGLLTPKLGNGHPEGDEKPAEKRKGKPDNIAVIPLDPLDEGATATVNGERPGNMQRLAGGNIRIDLPVGKIGEVHHRGPDILGLPPTDKIGEMVPGAEHPGATPHSPPPLRGLLGIPRLAQNLPIKGQDGVAAKNKNTRLGRQGGSHRPSLHPGQSKTERIGVRGLHNGLINPTDQHLSINTGGLKQRPPSRTGRSKHKARNKIGLHKAQRYKRSRREGLQGRRARRRTPSPTSSARKPKPPSKPPTTAGMFTPDGVGAGAAAVGGLLGGVGVGVG